MFSNKERLRQRTPANGIDRKEFINHLVDEFYETTNVGKYQRQLQLKVLLKSLTFVIF